MTLEGERMSKEYKQYNVVWEIVVWAHSMREAAENALEIQRDVDSTASVFEVCKDGGEPETVDLEVEHDADDLACHLTGENK